MKIFPQLPVAMVVKNFNFGRNIQEKEMINLMLREGFLCECTLIYVKILFLKFLKFYPHGFREYGMQSFILEYICKPDLKSTKR